MSFQSRDAVLRALEHFKSGHSKLEQYISTMTEVLSNLEGGAETLVNQSDEYVCQRSMKLWGLPVHSFSYSPEVHLSLPHNYAQVMLTEQSSGADMWSRGESSALVMELVGLLRARSLLRCSNFVDDAYFSKERDAPVRYDALIPIGGANFL